MLINLFYANRAKFPNADIFSVGRHTYQFKNDETARLVTPLSILASTVLAILAGQWGATQWEKILIFSNAVTIGANDPIIGMDSGFYLFRLPLIETFKVFAGFITLTTIVIVGAVYYFRGGISITERGEAIHGKGRKEEVNHEAEVAELHRQIGKLKVENDFLSNLPGLNLIGRRNKR